MNKPDRHADDILAEITGTCILSRTRLIARVVTSLYDDALRPYGLNAPQFSLLAAIRALDRPTRAEIGRRQQFDRSTLTRNLQVMMAEGWLVEVAVVGVRGRPIALTPQGSRLLMKAAAGWRLGQARAQAALGESGIADVKRLADGLVQSAISE